MNNITHTSNFGREHTLNSIVISGLVSLALAACGGGGGATSAPTGGGQTVTIQSLPISAEVAAPQIDFVQVINRTASEVGLRLTPNKPLLVRALVSSGVAGATNPGVLLLVTNGATTLGTLPMTGPGTVPTSPDVNSLSTTYNAEVPAAWVTPGVTFKVTVAATSAMSAPAVATAAPAVGLATKLHIVMVPLKVNGITAKLPDPAQVHDFFARTYPMANADIAIDTHAPVDEGSVSNGLTTTGMAVLLQSVEQLRQQEGSQAIYYGLMPSALIAGNIVGLSYVNSVATAAQANMSAVGYDDQDFFATHDSLDLAIPSYAQVMMHEVGHTHSLNHAPCGNPASVDANFPYAGGALNASQPVYDSLYDSDSSIGALGSTTPAGGVMTDMMGYCSGVYFSDYSYNKVQAFAEARMAALGASAAGAAPDMAGDTRVAADVAPTAAGFMLLSGAVTVQGVVFSPAQVAPRASAAVPQAATPYTVRVTIVTGQTFSYPVAVNEVEDGEESTGHFTLSIPNPGQVANVEVLKHGVALASQGGRAQALSASATDSALRAESFSESGGVLTLTWDNRAAPFATVIHVAADGKRQVVAMRLQGGKATVFTANLPAGGTFELSFSSMVNVRIVKMTR